MSFPLAVPAIPHGRGNARYAEFVTTGATFAPQVELAAGSPAEVTWVFSTGEVSHSLTPSVDFGVAGTRVQRLTCSDRDAVRILNLGYDAGDGGWYEMDMWPTQSVARVRNLQAFPRLTHFAANHCPLLGTLDFRGLAYLTEVECFVCSQVTAIDVRGCTALRRLCVEDCDLRALDLSDQTSLEDLRGALNAYQSITWPAGGIASLWHMCVRDNPTLVGTVANLAQYPALIDLLIWNTNQTGVLVPYNAAAANIFCGGNLLTSVDLSHCQGTVLSLNAEDNDLTSVTWGSTSGFNSVNLRRNALSQAEIDATLLRMRDYGAAVGTLLLQEGNAAPSATGLGYRDTLVTRGWTVTVTT